MNDAVSGHQKVVAKLKALRAPLLAVCDDPRIGDFLVRRTQARMRASVAPDGTPWRPLSASAIDHKRRQHYRYPDKPLLGTLTLYDAIQVIRGSNAGTSTTNTNLGLRVGIDPRSRAARYARTHQRGGWLRGHRVPQRRFLGLARADVTALTALYRREAAKTVSATFAKGTS